MEIILLIFTGILGGFFAGMGMGGGTLLIPILTIFLGITQKLAQGINLIGFIPMALVALYIHNKNHFVRFKTSLPIMLPGIIGALIGAYFIKGINNQTLSQCFGVFLILLGVFSIFKLLLFYKKAKKQ